MKNLTEIRNELLKLHKTLMDIERENYEAKFGKVSNLEFLNLLFENPGFTWLRELSSLVSQIDEVFADKSGIDQALVSALFSKSKILFDDSEQFKEFKSKYQANLRTEREVLKHHERLMGLIKNGGVENDSTPLI